MAALLTHDYFEKLLSELQKKKAANLIKRQLGRQFNDSIKHGPKEKNRSIDVQRHTLFQPTITDPFELLHLLAPDRLLPIVKCCQCMIVKQVMKHIGMDEILRRRTKSKLQQPTQPQQQQQFARCMSRQLREVNDLTIDHLVRIATKKEHLNHQHKLDLLRVISTKTGVNLNRHLLLNHLSLLHIIGVADLDENWQSSKKSYFLLKGSLQLWEHRPNERPAAKFNTQPYPSYEEKLNNYPSLEDFRNSNPDYVLLEEVEEFRGVGPLFGEGQGGENTRKLLAVEAVLAVLEETEHEVETMVHDGLAQQDKLEVLSYFPVLRVIGRRLNAFINNFKLKQYSLKELIYRSGEKPRSVYFLIRGQVSFQLLLQDSPISTNIQAQTQPHSLSTETVTDPSYFGEEEIVFKSDRVQSAEVVSSKCLLLELERDKFQKFMENAQFAELVTRAARLKQAERQKKIDRLTQILREKEDRKGSQAVSEAEARQLALTERPDQRRRFSRRRASQASVRLMHGHVIRQSPPKQQPVKFSMLEINPDMYEAAKKKLRKYSCRPVEYAPRRPWDFKKVWQILNLDDVLQEEELQLSAPQGKKYYECHRRLQHQVAETHSMRPKTTASNYRTKLQYIAYLQQFNQ